MQGFSQLARCIIWKFTDSSLELQKELRGTNSSCSDRRMKWFKCDCSLFNCFIFVSGFTYNLIIVLYSNDLLSVCLLIFVIYFMLLFIKVLVILYRYLYYFSFMIISDKAFSYIVLWILGKIIFPFPFLYLENSLSYESWWKEVPPSSQGNWVSDACFTSPSGHVASPILDFE